MTISLAKTNTLRSCGSPRKNEILYEGCLESGSSLYHCLTFKKDKRGAVESADEMWLSEREEICSQHHDSSEGGVNGKMCRKAPEETNRQRWEEWQSPAEL